MNMFEYEYYDEAVNNSEEVEYVQCYCEALCPFGPGKGICEITAPGGMCFSSIITENDEFGIDVSVRAYGCLAKGEAAIMQCKGSLVPHKQYKSIVCCDDSDFCNQYLDPVTGNKYFETTPFIILIASLIIFLILFLMGVAIYLKWYRKKEEANSTSQSEEPLGAPNTVVVDGSSAANRQPNEIRRNHLARVIGQSSGGGSGSGYPMMVQRTISQQIEMLEPVGKGRYGVVRLAKWRGEKVAVKVFPTTEEKSWFRETQVYRMMRHDNILGYIAADIKGTGTWTEMLLITEYHENGSLFNFLKVHTLTLDSFFTMSHSISNGLAYLHTEIFGYHGKPAIAHGDIKSKNILVKENGKCCIADFGLAVKYETNTNKIDLPSTERSGTKRYMAPELLDQTINLQHFDSLLMTDIYSFGLVLWEMSRRCVVGGHSALEYEVPFQKDVSTDPSFEEMQEVVCTKMVRPEIPCFWDDEEPMKIITKMIQEMWHDNPAVRLTALRVKKTLSRFTSKDAVKENETQ